MKKMTAEQMELARTLVRDGFTVPLLGMALEHISALEAEAAHARETAREEAATRCEALAEAADGHSPISASACLSCADAIRALKSKPAQDGLRCCGGTDQDPHEHTVDCDTLGPEQCLCSVTGEEKQCPKHSEKAAKESGPLPKKRRREHEYGEEARARFGSTVAKCVRPGCNAHRLKTRGGRTTLFRQAPGDVATAEPGPCEVET